MVVGERRSKAATVRAACSPSATLAFAFLHLGHYLSGRLSMIRCRVYALGGSYLGKRTL
jgi:hypothetical protein